MMASKQIGDFINHVVDLYFELCLRAETEYQMGPHSGAKRSVLLFLKQHGSCYSDELFKAFSDPAAPSYGATMIGELSQSCLVRLEYDGSRALLELTELGVQRCREIREQEAEIAKSLSPLLSMSDINKAASTIERFCHQIRETRTQNRSEKRHKKQKAA